MGCLDNRPDLVLVIVVFTVVWKLDGDTTLISVFFREDGQGRSCESTRSCRDPPDNFPLYDLALDCVSECSCE